MKALRPILVVAVFAAVPLAASAAKTFAGPSTWVHVVVAKPDAAQRMDVWKPGDSPAAPTLNVLVDTTTSYSEMIGAVRANAQSGFIKIVGDKDLTCGGVAAHEFDIELDIGRKILSTQTVVASPGGATRITYTRADGVPFAKEVQAAIDAFCS
ncbi:MAG: hypothetical protein WCE44_11605 [Candidatus Velthaea sp.]|jgi:hypothetical protein